MIFLSEAQALVISAAIEGPIAFAIVRAAEWPSRGALHVGVASMAATAVTHPQLWAAAYWAYPRFPYWPAILVLEALVIAAEGVMIAWMAQLALSRAMIVSSIANSASFLFGLWLAS
ncbi:MAG: hypothetical protein ABR878_16295 [Roseiarcus sp.]|jgi:hypothetical protein